MRRAHKRERKERNGGREKNNNKKKQKKQQQTEKKVKKQRKRKKKKKKNKKQRKKGATTNDGEGQVQHATSTTVVRTREIAVPLNQDFLLQLQQVKEPPNLVPKLAKESQSFLEHLLKNFKHQEKHVFTMKREIHRGSGPITPFSSIGTVLVGLENVI